MRKYLVGGAVRDMLMGREPHDFDYTVEADSFESMKNELSAEGYRLFMVNEDYLTIRAHKDGQVSDFVLARDESQSTYSDGRRPDSVKPGTILDDLARRDFRMNSVAIDEAGNYIDPYNGQQDIVDRAIRCVGNIRDRMEEDGLRALRALRFSVTLGFFIDPYIKFVVNDPKFVDNHLANVSIERVQQELEKMFKFNTVESMRLLHEYHWIRNYVFKDTLWLLPTLKSR